MFFPLRHENMAGRRLPVISLSLIVINFLAFLGTYWQFGSENPRKGEVRAHILLLAASHPELTMPEKVQEMVAAYQQAHPDVWAEASSHTRDVADAWDARVRLMEEPAQFQAEMDSLTAQWMEMTTTPSVLDKYAFVPAHPTAISYLTANFLHGGWLHIIGNMWFLWIAGAILEDTWGRVIYPIFYLVAGAAALQIHAWFNHGSEVPTLGASGAVAALMGAFLVRFPKSKIEVALILGIRSLINLCMGRGIRIKAAAYWLLPAWLLTEIFSGFLVGKSSGVAHWAHVGGFAFGALAALALKHSGLEKKANDAIEAKVSWTADPAIVQATELMEQGQLDGAAATLQGFLASKPDSADGYTLLSQVYWRKNDAAAYRDAMAKLIQLHLKRNNLDTAWQEYVEFKNGGAELSAAVWLELCRAVENAGNHERAASEYELLAKAHPAERPGLLALLAAGRLSLKNLQRPADALRFYEAAAKSPVPHLDWETNIKNGIENAKKALSAGSGLGFGPSPAR
jgi:membrane associated rhomboid family serine protease